MKPIGEKLLIKPLSNNSESESGIYIGDADRKEKFLEKGMVVDKGIRVDITCKPGDTVYYDRWAGTPVSMGDSEYLMIKQDQIQAIENV